MPCAGMEPTGRTSALGAACFAWCRWSCFGARLQRAIGSEAWLGRILHWGRWSGIKPCMRGSRQSRREAPTWLTRNRPAGNAKTASLFLSFVAGYVDSSTFLALLGFFVAQLTGSFVTVEAQIAQHQQGILLTIFAIPTFLLAGIQGHAAAKHQGLSLMAWAGGALELRST